LNIAKAVARTKADGCVIGLTGFVKPEFVKKVQDIVNDKTIFLLQGLGPQGGEMSKIKHVKNPLVSLGREIIYSKNPKQVAIEYREKFEYYRTA
jgi:orotidine-5'-phosphate decarboxylase